MRNCNNEVMTLKQIKRAIMIDTPKLGISYFHYTDTPGFLSMVKNGLLYLSRVDCLNDGNEDFLASKRFYVGCFSTSIGESVALWAIYGNGRSDALRLRFSGRTLADLFGGRNKRIEIFEVTDSGRGRKLGMAKVLLSYVAYASRTYPTFAVRNRRMTLERLKDVPRGALDQFWWKELSPFAKLNSWEYEREVRLVVEVEKELDCKKIAIDFARPLEELLEYNPKTKRRHLTSVLMGPWSSQEDCSTLSRDVVTMPSCPTLCRGTSNFLTEQVGVSELAGKIRLRMFGSKKQTGN